MNLVPDVLKALVEFLRLLPHDCEVDDRAERSIVVDPVRILPELGCILFDE